MNERIRELRQSLNLSQGDFAESIGLTKNYISLVETGNRSLAKRTVKDICRIYDVNEKWLTSGEGEPFSRDSDEKETQGSRIRAIRKNAHLTQTEFGEKIGVKGNSITSYETGLRKPSNAIILSICREFSINEEWLRTGNGEMFMSRIKRPVTNNFYAGSQRYKMLSELCEAAEKMTDEQLAAFAEFAKKIVN